MALIQTRKSIVIVLLAISSLSRPSLAEELVPFVEIATNQDCGVNCLVIACRMFNLPVEKSEIAALAKLTPQGTSLFHLSEAARSKGLHTRIVKWSTHQLARWPDPAIAHWENHFVLVAGQTETDKDSHNRLALKIIDPPLMPYMLDRDTFNKKWDGHCLLLSQRPIRAWRYPSPRQTVLYLAALVCLTLTAYGMRKAKIFIRGKTP